MFIVDNTDGTLTLTLQPGELNGPGSVVQNTDLRLYGMGSMMWGEGVNENILRVAENWACPEKVAVSPPTPQDENDLAPGLGVSYPLEGQTWYNKTDQSLYFYTGSAWRELASSSPGVPSFGEIRYSTGSGPCGNDQLEVYNGSIWISASEHYFPICGGTVTGTTTIDGVLNVNSILHAFAHIDADSSVTIGGTLTTNGHVDVNSSLTADGLIISNGELRSVGAFNALGISTFNNTVITNAPISAFGHVTTNPSSTFTTNGHANLTGGVDVVGNDLTLTSGADLILHHDPVLPLEAVTLQYLQSNYDTSTTVSTLYLKKDGTDAMDGGLDMSNFVIRNLGNPVNDTDAISRIYADFHYVSLDKDSVVNNNGTTKLTVKVPDGALGNTIGSVDTLVLQNDVSGADAFMTFHVSGDYAVHFGLDGTTNDLFVGGWSMGATKNKIWHEGNLPKSAVGNRWGVIPEVQTDGVMEVGRNIDFHNSDGNTSDYDVRLATNSTTTDLYINGSKILTEANFSNEQAVQVDYFYLSGTWTKPGAGLYFIVEIWGGGGGGGRDANDNGGGGGGGAYNRKIFTTSELGATVPITIGAGGNGATSDGNGGAGGTTTFGTYLTAYGGGRGGGASTSGGGGGGGGGLNGAGGNASGCANGLGGGTLGANFDGGDGGEGCSAGAIGGNSIVGGGGGGGQQDNVGNGRIGGSSVYGGGGGAASGNNGGVGASAGGFSVYGGNGGYGGQGGINAQDGRFPAGGGGGAYAGSAGDGANGFCLVWTIDII